MSWGDDFCALSMCKGTDRDGAAFLSACSSLCLHPGHSASCWARLWQGSKESSSFREGGSACTSVEVKCWILGIQNQTHRQCIDSMSSVQPFYDCRVIFFHGCWLDEIYIRSWKKCRFISFCRQLLSCITGCTGWKAGKFRVLDCTNSVCWQLRKGPSHFTKRLVIKAEQSESKGRMYSKWHCSRDVTIWKM